jgi:hypothetical protein
MTDILEADALLGASCDGDDADETVGTDIGADRPTTTVPESTTTAPPATTTTTAAPTPEEEILAAHAGYWAVVDEAFSLPQVQPDLPALSRYATGEALERVRQSADETLQANEAYRRAAIPRRGAWRSPPTPAIDASHGGVEEAAFDGDGMVERRGRRRPRATR